MPPATAVSLTPSRALGRTREAIDEYQAALRLDPKIIWVRNNLAIALEREGRLDETIQQLQEAVRTDSRFTQPHYNLAEAFSRRGRIAEAVQQCRAALVADPKYADAHGLLGKSLMRLGQLDEAADHLRQAVALSPKDNEMQRSLRTALIRQRRLAEARTAWQKAIDADPPEHAAWFGYAELCAFLGDEDDYRRNRRALLVRFGGSNDPTVCERTAKACLLLPGTKDEMSDAAALADRALAADRKGRESARPYAAFAKGLAAYRQRRFDEAVALMKGEAAGATSLLPSPRIVMAMAQFQMGHKDLARKTLAAAVASYDWSAAKADNHDRWIIHVLRREAESLILPEPAGISGRKTSALGQR